MNIPEECFKEASTILKWLTISQRPLHLIEVAEAAVIEPGVLIDADLRLTDPYDILDMCSGLVTTSINDANQVEIRLVHISLKEYLLSNIILDGPASHFAVSSISAHEFIAASCLSYILATAEYEVIDDNADDIISPEVARETVQATEKAFPLLSYAVNSWCIHVRLAENHVHEKALEWNFTDADDEESKPYIRSLTLKFFESARAFLTWISIFDLDEAWESRPLNHSRDKLDSALYYACKLGLSEVTKALLELGANVNAQGGDHDTALQAATWAGHEKIILHLLANAADPNIEGGYYGSALQVAAEEGNEAIAKILLANGANVDAQGGHYGNALRAAVLEGHESMMRLLFKAGVNVDAPAGDRKKQHYSGTYPWSNS